MKKAIGFVMVMFIVIALLTGCEKQTVILVDPQINGEIQPQAVMIDGTLYYNTEQLIYLPRCGLMDGTIDSAVSEYELPAENNQSNFGTGYEYQIADSFHIDIAMGNAEGWTRFCNGECKTSHEEDLCGVPLNGNPTPPPGHIGSWFCIPVEKSSVSNLFTKEIQLLSDEDEIYITDMLKNGIWVTEGTSDCLSNIEFVIEGETYLYHSDCGTFNDNKNQRSLSLDNSEKETLNALLEKYVSLSRV